MASPRPSSSTHGIIAGAAPQVPASHPGDFYSVGLDFKNLGQQDCFKRPAAHKRENHTAPQVMIMKVFPTISASSNLRVVKLPFSQNEEPP